MSHVRGGGRTLSNIIAEHYCIVEIAQLFKTKQVAWYLNEITVKVAGSNPCPDP